jgi:hypothetical protein
MIKKLFIVLFVCCASLVANGQSFTPSTEVGFFLGGSYYIGDLNEEHFSLTQPAVGLVYRQNFNRRFSLKAAGWAGEVRGSDKINNLDTAKYNRNLHFKSPIYEFSGQVEFNFFEYETGSNRFPFSPFVFTGLSFYSFNPQARRYDTNTPFDFDGEGTNNPWVELQPLGTEGQNIAHYPEKEPYQLFQLAIPLGVGFKLSLGQQFSMVAEYGIRKTFTDYLDDVGGTYADPQVLQDYNIITADLSDRSLDALEYIATHPGTDIAYWTRNTDKLRANENNWDDWYAFAGITFCYKIVKTPKVCQY